MKKLFLLLSVIALFHTADAAGAKTKLLEPTPENCVYYSVEDLITKYFGIAEPGTTDTQVFNKLNALGLEPYRDGSDIEVNFLPNGWIAGRPSVKKFCSLRGAPVVPASATFELMNWSTSDNMSYDFVFSLKKVKNAFQKSAEESAEFAQFIVSEIEKAGIKLEYENVENGDDWKFRENGDTKVSVTRRTGNGANYYWVRINMWDMYKKPWEKKEDPVQATASTPESTTSHTEPATQSQPQTSTPSYSSPSVPYLDILNQYSSADPTHITGNIVSSERRNVGKDSDVYIFTYDNGWEKTVQVMPCWGCINGVNGMMQRCTYCSGTGVKVIISAYNPKTGYYTDPSGNPVPVGGGSGAASGYSSGGSSIGNGSGSDSNSLYKTCHYCNGTGLCSSCKGKGVLQNTYSGSWYDCTSCSGTGHCFNCNGRGRY